MQAEFWHARWRTGQTGFHQNAVDKFLSGYWAALALPERSKVFVPLCGKSLDLLWLLGQGMSVTGVELSAIAVEALCMEHGIPAQRRTLGRFEVYESPRLELYCGDFFALTRALLGTVAAVYDRAALISWAPELRPAYVEHLTSLTLPGTQTLLITMEYPQAQMTGPPFSVSGADVDHLYAPGHTIRELARRDILASEPRLRARGLTELTEVCYHLTRTGG